MPVVNNTQTVGTGTKILQSQDDRVAKKIKDLEKQIKLLQSGAAGTISLYQDDPVAAYIVDTPMNNLGQRYLDMEQLNPNIFAASRQVDDMRQRIADLNAEKINLQTAQEQMFGSLNNAKNDVNRSLGNQLSSIAGQKENQVAAAQGLAGKSGASSGMLANANTQISNQFAPQSLSAQAQANQNLANIEAQKADIPGKLSAIQSQNINNEFNREKIKELMNSYNAKYKANAVKSKEADIVNEILGRFP